MDEMTKNHRENDKENIPPIIPEIPDSAYCPVSSYELYISKLNPGQRLWQRPLSTFSENDDVWYAKVPVEQKVLGAFMSELSKSCELSQVYTNHSIRATGVTVLSKGMFGPTQIMAVTGHKSVQSLSVYQRVDEEEKNQMSKTLIELLVLTLKHQLALLPCDISRPVIQSCSSLKQLPVATTSTADDLVGVDIGALLDNFGSTYMSNTTTMQTSQTNPTIFNNCTFTIIFLRFKKKPTWLP
ncbi:uncharacterized protein LOC125681899 [Ostrea edulis]|uniref:uncharacterized protein LOC125681899 n=1 Tax=Ostrea edulis TaxID=37623 RepID=UPI0024AFBBCE|nr:uncharacterized protein LOC125681899 [Ostrea edulis]